jgi:O-antigen/teichoic acid export membrane protein
MRFRGRTDPRRSTAESALSRARTRKLALTSAAIASSGATTLIFNVAAARSLSPIEFGDVAREWSTAMLVAQLTMAGISPALARHIGQRERDGERWSHAWGGLRLLWICALACSLLYPVLTVVGLAPVSIASIAAGWAVATIYPIYFGMKSFLFVLDRVKLYAKLEFAADALFYILLALLLTQAAQWVVASFALSYGCFVIVVARIVAHRASIKAKVAVSVPLVRYTGFAMLSTYASVARFPAVVVVAGVVTGTTTAGQVSALLALLTPLLLVPQAASMLTFATFARARTADEARDLPATVRLTFTVTMVPIVLGVLLAPTLLAGIYGSSFATLAPAFGVLLLGLGPMVAGMPIGNALAGSGAVKTTAAVAIPGFLVTVSAAAGGGYMSGGSGLLVGCGIGTALTGVALALIGAARLELRFKDFADGLLLMAVGAIALFQPLAAVAAGALAVGALAFRHLHMREVAVQ